MGLRHRGHAAVRHQHEHATANHEKPPPFRRGLANVVGPLRRRVEPTRSRRVDVHDDRRLYVRKAWPVLESTDSGPKGSRRFAPHMPQCSRRFLMRTGRSEAFHRGQSGCVGMDLHRYATRWQAGGGEWLRPLHLPLRQNRHQELVSQESTYRCCLRTIWIPGSPSSAWVFLLLPSIGSRIAAAPSSSGCACDALRLSRATSPWTGLMKLISGSGRWIRAEIDHGCRLFSTAQGMRGPASNVTTWIGENSTHGR